MENVVSPEMVSAKRTNRTDTALKDRKGTVLRRLKLGQSVRLMQRWAAEFRSCVKVEVDVLGSRP